jgi:hypothetical protein
MRMLTIFVAALSVITLTACSGPDDSGQSHRGQAGPYIGGSGGVGVSALSPSAGSSIAPPDWRWPATVVIDSLSGESHLFLSHAAARV